MRCDCDYLWLPLYEDSNAAWSVALIGDLLIRIALAEASGALNRALDVVVRHVERSTFVHGQSEARIGCWVRSADTCGDGDLA